MEFRKLGNTGLDVSVVSFGASSMGQEFRQVDLSEALRCVPAALDAGMNLIDTSPFYGRGMSEVLLGQALKGIARDRYLLCTKLGRYDVGHFDFSARRVAESVDISLHRMGVEHLDIVLCHDIEFVDLAQIVEETLPALRKQQEAGKVRFIGFSGYPTKVFTSILDQTNVDVILSYNQYTLQNRRLGDLAPYFQEKGVGIMNAGPFAARLLSNAPLPDWHKDSQAVRDACRRAGEHCQSQGVDIAQLALQFSIANEAMTTCITGSANPQRIQQWAEWADEPLDTHLVAEVEEILAPVMNESHPEGLPENN